MPEGWVVHNDNKGGMLPTWEQFAEPQAALDHHQVKVKLTSSALNHRDNWITKRMCGTRAVGYCSRLTYRGPGGGGGRPGTRICVTAACWGPTDAVLRLAENSRVRR